MESHTDEMNASEDQGREFQTVLYFFILLLSWSGGKKVLCLKHCAWSGMYNIPLPFSAKC